MYYIIILLLATSGFASSQGTLGQVGKKQCCIFYPSTVLPAYYVFDGMHAMTVNGSSTRNCSHGEQTECIVATGVLFDGIIPTLNELNGSIWASQILTLQTTTNVGITFNFTADNYVGFKKTEIIIFNCPQWGISIQTIRLYTLKNGTLLAVHNVDPTLSSCDSFIRVCLSYKVSSASQVIYVQLDLGLDSNWAHIAEIEFSNSDIVCPPDGIANTSTSTLSTSTTNTMDVSTSSTNTMDVPTSTTMMDVSTSTMMGSDRMFTACILIRIS